MASKLGNFFVDLGAKPDTSGIDKFGSSLKGLAKIASGIGATIAGLGVGFFLMVKNTAKETAEIGRMSQDLGVSVQKLDQFQKMFELAGGNAEDATTAISELNSKIIGFKFGEYEEQLGQKLGLAPQDFTDNFLNNIELIRKRLNTLYKPSEKESILSSIGLGNSIRLLRLTDIEYKNLEVSAKKAGLASKQQVESSTDFYKNMILANQEFRSFKRELMTITAPAFADLIKELRELLANKDFRQGVGDFFSTVIKSMPLLINSINMLAQSIMLLVNASGAISGTVGGIFKGAKKAGSTLWQGAKHSWDTQKSYMPKTASVNTGTSSNISDNSVYAPNITVNSGTSSDAKNIADAVAKTLQTHYKQAKESNKGGKL